jgi:hypothetical protein
MSAVMESPAENLMQQLRIVEEKLVPFWGHMRTTMEYAPDDGGGVIGVFNYKTPDGRNFTCPFICPKEMAKSGPNGENPLLKYIADTFRGFMLLMPYDIRMKGPWPQYPTDSEIEEECL